MYKIDLTGYSNIQDTYRFHFHKFYIYLYYQIAPIEVLAIDDILDTQVFDVA